MGKGGAVLGLIGILLGAGGLGFAFIAWNNQNTLETQLTGLAPQEIWYRYYEDFFDVDLQNTYLEIPNMSISIDLTTQASIHLLFTCRAYTTGGISRSDVVIYFYIDEITISNPSVRVGSFNATSLSFYHQVALQYYIAGWPAGTHNISMFVRSTVTTNKLQYCALTVRSFPV